MIDAIERYARERGMPVRDARQTFLQVVVLRHLSDPAARFMGGTALVLGYGNPRFSEDVDLTQVSHPRSLEAGLIRAKTELEGWFGAPASLLAPKAGGRTWRLTLRLGRSESASLHIDSQPYRALTSRAVVIEYPSLPPTVCEALEVEEIMAEKVIALAYRRYLGGRDLFDLWFHWLRSEEESTRRDRIVALIEKKLPERKIEREDFRHRLASRLSDKTPLDRARAEWRRYLPTDFQRPSVVKDILDRCRRLMEIVT